MKRNYTKSSFKKYEDKILAAKELLKKDNFDPNNLKKLISDIKGLREDLQHRATPKRIEEAKAKIEEAKVLYSNEKYDKEDREELKKATEASMETHKDFEVDSTEQEIDALIEFLDEKIEEFKENQEVKPDKPASEQKVEVIIETKNKKFKEGSSDSDIFIINTTLGTKISDILKDNKNIWKNDFSLGGKKPSGWKINNGETMTEDKLKSTLLSKDQVQNNRIIISAVYEKKQTNLKKIIIKEQKFKVGNQVILDHADKDSKEWLNMISKGNSEFKVLNKGETLRKSSNSFTKGYNTRDEYLFLYLLDNGDYIRVKVDGYEDVFFKIQKRGFDSYINKIDKKELPTELLNKN